jgi:hypothetical protein
MYPVEKLPLKISEAYSALPPPPYEPHKPVAPQLPKFYPKAEIIDLLPLAIIITFSISLFFVFWNFHPLANILAYISFMFILFGFRYVFKEPLAYFDYRRQDKEKIKEDLDFYNEQLKYYNGIAVPSYPEKVREWKLRVAENLQKAFIERYRVDCVSKILSASGVPLNHPKNSDFKKGIYEQKVLEHLLRHFPNKIYIGGTAKDEKGEVGKWAPLPDFVVHDNDIGYNLVVEVDEPYDLQYGYPIHCIDSDDSRDEYFLRQNWLVLRFAEIQWVNQPNECCDYIAKFINEATLGSSSMVVSGIFKNLLPVNSWSESDAAGMELSGLRESYLPAELLGNGFSGFIYKNNGPAIRKKRREDFIAQELAYEAERVQRIKKESEDAWLRTLRGTAYNEDNDLPF